MEKGFIQYLLAKKLVDKQTILRAIETQKKRYAVSIGEIALRLNVLTQAQVDTILDIQVYEDKMFGEIGVRMGFLKDKDIDKLLGAQRRLRSSVAKILTEMEVAPADLINEWHTSYLNEASSVKYYCKGCNVSVSKDDWENGVRACPECGKILTLAPPKDSGGNIELELNPELKKVFISTCLRCPVCGIEEEYLYVSNSAYTIQDRDDDLKPVYVWLDKNLEKYNVAAFNVWQCQNCSYTALREYFEEPVQETTLSLSRFRSAVSAALSNGDESKRIIFFLKEKLSVETTDILHAVRRLLLSAYILERIELIKNQDSLPLARTLLRLAWAHRDISGSPEPERDRLTRMLGKLYDDIEPVWPSFPRTEEDALRMSLAAYENAFYQSPVPENKGIEHSILHIMGSLQMKLGDRAEGMKNLMKARASSTAILSAAEAKIKETAAAGSLSKQIKDMKTAALQKQTARIKTFLREINDQIEKLR